MAVASISCHFVEDIDLHEIGDESVRRWLTNFEFGRDIRGRDKGVLIKMTEERIGARSFPAHAFYFGVHSGPQSQNRLKCSHTAARGFDYSHEEKSDPVCEIVSGAHSGECIVVVGPMLSKWDERYRLGLRSRPRLTR